MRLKVYRRAHKHNRFTSGSFCKIIKVVQLMSDLSIEPVGQVDFTRQLELSWDK